MYVFEQTENENKNINTYYYYYYYIMKYDVCTTKGFLRVVRSNTYLRINVYMRYAAK